MKNSRWFKFSGGLVAALFALGAGVVHAEMAGTKLIQAFGGATEAESGGASGSVAMAGVVTLNNNGGASQVSVTFAYQDNDADDEGFTCALSQPSDLTYSFPNGLNAAGTMTLTVSDSDLCWQSNDPGNFASGVGSVTFNIYARNGNATIVNTSTTLFNPFGENLAMPLSMAGSLTATGGALNQISGLRLLNAAGGASDNFTDGGNLALAGLVNFTAKGGASALDVTISYSDEAVDNFSCELTNPADLSYSLANGIGTLELTVSQQDANTTCKDPDGDNDYVGDSITFYLYSIGGQARMIASTSTFDDHQGDLIDSLSVVGSF